MIISTRSLTESLEKKYNLKESYWWEDWENLPKERTDEISKWAKNYVDEICKYDLSRHNISGPKFEDSNEKFTVIINNKIFNFDWADVWVNKAYYDESREENLPDNYEDIYDPIDDDPIGYRIISTIESINADPKYSVDYSDGKLDEAYEDVDDNSIDYSQGEPLNDDSFMLDWYEFYDDQYDHNWYACRDHNAMDAEIVVWPTRGDCNITIYVDGKEYFSTDIDYDGVEDALDFAEDCYREEVLGESLDESLTEAENPENAEINSVIRRTVGKKNISKKDAKALADAGIERDEYGDLTGKNGRRLVKSGTAIHGPGKTYHKYQKTDYQKGHDGKTTRWDLRKNSADMVGSRHADKWDKVDLKNYLDSEKPESAWETERENNKKLRPYSDKYQEYKRRKDSASWGVDRANRDIKSEEEIERMVQEYRDRLLQQRQHDLEWAADREGSKEYYDKQIKDIQAQAKAKHPQYESLNEAQLNENPLIAAAARAAIPAAINVASNAISSAIDAKLHDGDNLEEDFWDPGEEFQNFEYLLYDEFDESGWNEWDQIQRDAFAEKVAKRYLELNPTPTPMFYQDLTDNNFHTYRKAFERLLGGNLTEAEGSDNELSFDEIMAKEKTSGNMDWYKKDNPNWKQVTEEE